MTRLARYSNDRNKLCALLGHAPSPGGRHKRRWHWFQLRALVLFFVCCHPLVLGESGEKRRAAGAEQFTQGVLFRRFDANSNGRLDIDEKIALRDAFGAIDVPMLPTTPFEYTPIEWPSHVRPSKLRQLENTPADNPISNQGAALGRVLFYDKQLSRNNTIACASCHHQQNGFSDPRQFSVGFEGRHTRRNAMGLANLRYSNINGNQPGFFWDERAPTLEVQALMPIQDDIEMGMELEVLEEKLQQLPYYPQLFEAAFGSSDVTRQRVAKAVAQFVRSMESWNSKFDQAAAKSGLPQNDSADFDGFTAQENLGKALFFAGVGGIAEFGCAHCHVPPTFGMSKSLNNGLDLRYEDQGLGSLDRPPNDPFTPSNDGKFKAPSLRNIELTAPYMHDGRFNKLEQVVEHYSSGIHPHVNLGLAFEDQDSVQSTSGFKLTDKQKAGLVAFLKTLTDQQFVSDPKFADPFVRLPTDAN